MKPQEIYINAQRNLQSWIDTTERRIRELEEERRSLYEQFRKNRRDAYTQGLEQIEQ